jgi:hypothetical protein
VRVEEEDPLVTPARRPRDRLRTLIAPLVATAAGALGLVPAAEAQDPERWLLTGASSVPSSYWQGLTSTPDESAVFFTGFAEGLWQTTPTFRQTAGVANAIPPAVKQAEGYNHIGDPSWDPTEGGRVLLPLECFVAGVGNTCGTGAFGVADADTLAFRYYVKLDPAQIAKAMWAETSPDGSLIWTSSGNDLLAYASSEVTAANAAPSGRLLRPVRRLSGAVPPSGITGAVFHDGKLLLSGETGGAYEVWAVDTESGARELVLEMSICGESEGLDAIPTLGGELHWLIAPFDPRCRATFGPSSALLHFVPTPKHQRFEVEVIDLDLTTLPGPVEVTISASHKGRPLRQTRVMFAGATGRTDKDGVATIVATLDRPGRFRALAQRGQSWGASELVPVGLAAAAVLGAPISATRGK